MTNKKIRSKKRMDKQIIEEDMVNAEKFCPYYSCEVDCYEARMCQWFVDTLQQLKVKEQECENLKEELILKQVANIELSDEVKKYRKAIDEIDEIADNNYEIAEMEQIFLIIGGLDV